MPASEKQAMRHVNRKAALAAHFHDIEQTWREMMRNEDRKAALAAYKERKTVAGIYTMRCLPTGQRWIGRAADLGTIQNRLWFTLRHGSHPHRGLQSAWREHGADNFAFEEVERLEAEALSYVRERLLKDRLVHWCTALGAEAI